MKFTVHQASLQGKRHENQDRMGHIYTRDALLLVVCDGLGGHAHGEEASQWVLETVAQRFQRFATPSLPAPDVFLEASVMAAHSRILKATLQRNYKQSPRTTFVGALIQHGKLNVAHAGDSRCYLIRRGEIVFRTRDHSKLQHLITMGRMDQATELSNHPERNKLVNCVGAEVDPIIEHSSEMVLEENDVVLLCSDGVWGSLEDADILSFVTKSELDKLVPSLVERAHIAGGMHADDATVVAMRWLDHAKPYLESDLEAKTDGKFVDSAEVADSGFHSTIQITVQADHPSGAPLSDDEIDASIEEINAAIAKSKLWAQQFKNNH